MALTVKQVEAKSGVSAGAIRWYVRRGLLAPRRSDGNGYHDFGPADLRVLRFIRRAQSLGFSLAEIKDVLARARRRESPCSFVRQVARRRLAEIAARLESLHATERRLRKALWAWKDMPDRAPQGGGICGLLDALPGAAEPGARSGAPNRPRR